MSRRNFLPFYVGDYLRDTQRLGSATDHGIYLLLLFNYWAEGEALPDDLLLLKRITGGNEGKIKAILERYFVLDGEVWRNARMDKELDKSLVYHERAKKGAAGRWKDKDDDKDASSTCLDDAPITITTNHNQNHNHSITKTSPQDYDVPPSTADNKKDDSGLRKYTDSAIKILSYLNAMAGTNYQPVAGTLKYIVARLKEKATEEECFAVVRMKVAEWQGTHMHSNLKPSTLFNSVKYPEYVGQLGTQATSSAGLSTAASAAELKEEIKQGNLIEHKP